MVGSSRAHPTSVPPRSRTVLAALVMLVLPAACAGAEVVEGAGAAAPSATTATTTRVAAGTFPAIPGYTYGTLPDDVWPQVWTNLGIDFDHGLAAAVGVGVDDAEGTRVAVLIVARPVTGRAGHEQMSAALHEQVRRASESFGVADTDDVAGHEMVIVVEASGRPTWYWVSGAEFVIVRAVDAAHGGPIAAQLSARTL